MLIVEDADVSGNFCLEGHAHINGDADFGPNDVHLHCGGTYTSGYFITPPVVHTDPDHFPSATYYYIRGDATGGLYHGRIFDRYGNDMTTVLGDSLTSVTTFDPGTGTFSFAFMSGAIIEHYFDDAMGVFRRNSGDDAVVVNFGEPPLIDPPGVEGTANLVFDGSQETVIHATIINTRYIGPPDDFERIHWTNWDGGLTEIKQIAFEPYYGFALLVHDFDKISSARAQVGTEAWAALLYATRDLGLLGNNTFVRGSLICLRDLVSLGGQTVTFDPGFLCNLPDYLELCPPGSGACCFDSVCEVMTYAQCTDSGGDFQGDGTDCDPNPCLPSNTGETGETDVGPAIIVAPNPVSDRMEVRYRIPTSGTVRLGLFDVGGRLVREIYQGWKEPGSHGLFLDGVDGTGSELPGGVYFLRLETSFGRVRQAIAVAR
jgi:hypothetical protein